MTTDHDAYKAMATWLCHKMVRAAKIVEVRWRWNDVSALVLESLSGEPMTVTVSLEWLARHQPAVGGYYVAYEDGYYSYSPAQAFESGYTRIDEE